MNPTLQTKIRTGCDEILVLGFDGSFTECLINYPGKDFYKFRELENSFLAFQHLEELIGEGENADCLPKAIVCEFGALQEEQFLLLTNIRNHPQFKYIPFIAMNRDGLNHKLEALQLGFDDYYDVPVQWQVLKDRITFLIDFKKKIDTCPIEQESLSIYISPFKRCFDIAVALFALLLVSPLLAVIALLIKFESKGPVIYCSKRVGTGYQVFNFFKFRSMYQDADKRLKDLKHLNQYNDEQGLFLKFNNDPRVTLIGRVLRKTSLDELPQLFNILKGDMSIVGNRPLPLYEAELLTRDAWAKRFLAPAGLTGLWQVTKRGKLNMSTEERISLDIDYAKNHSFWFDLKIILKTIPAMIQDENV